MNEEKSTLISVHLPKTAGTSFFTALEEAFKGRILRDYADFPINTPVVERNRSALENSLKKPSDWPADTECIHGHFLPVKYLLAADVRRLTFITWMRNPVDRLLSHYYFWQRSYDPAIAPPLHRRMMEESWSLERFCLGPEVQNLYSQFLWAFPMRNFDFIGITENYAADLAYFSRHYLASSLEAMRLNRDESGAARSVDAQFRSTIENHHAKDMALYEYALASARRRTA